MTTVAEPSDDMEVLRLAREQGLISESEMDRLLAEQSHHTDRGRNKPVTSLAIERGLLTEQHTYDLQIQSWINQLDREFDGYEVNRLLGRGGMAVVFEGHDHSLGKRVALKVLLPEFSRNNTYLARFHREARIAAKLTHPNTVQVFRCGEQNGVQYLVMEYVEGETLADVIRNRGRMPEEEAVDIILQLTGALEEAAELGIVHRDIKPANVLMSKWGMPRLTDFGIAKEFSDLHDPKIQMSLTMGIVGTPTYMSPEQARGVKQIDLRADIYSLGATLYHLVVGDVPFFADTPQETMVRVVSESPRPPRRLRPDLSEPLAAIICKMMAKEPDDRYRSYAELEEDLEAVRNAHDASLSYREALKLLLPTRQDDSAGYDEEYEEEDGAADPRRIMLIAGGVALIGVVMLFLLNSC